MRIRSAALVGTAALLAVAYPAARALPAAAATATTITDTDAADSADPFDMQQASTTLDPATASFTIQDYQAFGTAPGVFIIAVDVNGDGVADYWIPVGYGPASQGAPNTFSAGVGQAGSGHLLSIPSSSITESSDSKSVTLSFPRSEIAGSTSFDWEVLSESVGTSGSTVLASLPDTPTISMPQVVRIAGTDRIDTSIQSSFFEDQSAGAVVLAREDDFADALGGAPLAAAKNGPLLLTSSTSLDPRTLAEIQRVLPQGLTVYLLGGTSALSQSVFDAVQNAGYHAVRIAGQDRYDTSLQILEQGLGTPSTIFLTTGNNFPDALSAGAAAAAKHGAILLTNGSQLPPEIASYLQGHPNDTDYAIGGPAAAAYPSATAIVGADRYVTSVKVAQTFFSQNDVVGVTSGLNYPDALAGSATMAEASVPSPLLLTDPQSLPASVQQYVGANKNSLLFAFVFGGTGAVSDNVVTQLESSLG